MEFLYFIGIKEKNVKVSFVIIINELSCTDTFYYVFIVTEFNIYVYII